ncbi:uncharacterized protein LOC130688523 [Daphnia carinata]|uniref:uncharacterized protein LOC130688523 n=1 Tax=Daphnia carinata TaxID=120202 RepID=UPI00257E43F5|nr:uncharacterized protein LOC130688523 [Daphnia carinata]
MTGCGIHKGDRRGLLFLTMFVLISGNLLVSQNFLLILTSNGQRSLHVHHNRTKLAVGTSAELNHFVEHGDTSQEDKLRNPSYHTSEKDKILRGKNPAGFLLNDHTDVVGFVDINYDTRRKEETIEKSRIKENTRRYLLRSERIRNVCKSRAVVSNPPVFTTSKKKRLVHSPLAANAPVPFQVENPVTSHFSLAPSFHTMGCFLNKVASSSLVSAFLLVRGLAPSLSSPHRYSGHLLPKSLEEFKFANETYFKFMFVRHPMDRMLSCYLDKMVNSQHHSLPAFRVFVKNRANQIIKNQHDRSNKPQRRNLLWASKDPSFIWQQLKSKVVYRFQGETGFLGITSEAQDTKMKKKQLQPATIFSQRTKPSASTNVFNTTESKPTFEEFLEFVLDTDLQGIGYDSHWVPFHRYCSPCSVFYDVIGKLETAFDDFQYIWEKTGLETKFPVPWINHKTLPSKSKIALEKKYYSSLPRELILRFYDAFRMDFELFDYSINEVLIKAGYETV